MGSSNPTDRSLGNGISLPQWMRGKVDNRFDFDQSAFSPPSHDDSFLYISHPKSVNSSTQITRQDGFHSMNTVLRKQGKNVVSEPNAQIKKLESVARIDFSRHPLPCQPFVPTALVEGREKKKPTSSGNKSVAKSQGTDDGFHGEPALCGKSIVHVANQIMTRALGNKMDPARSDEQMDRSSELKIGSRSLPVSPTTTPISTPDSSPKSRRRMKGNRFFTGAFIPDRDKYQGGWLLSSILSQSREVIGDKIEEGDEPSDIDKLKSLHRKKSISSQNLSYLSDEKVHQTKKSTSSHSVVFHTEPSELREMNFWSPTSM